jgi:dTDP-4-dehydrorhamnose reductase
LRKHCTQAHGLVHVAAAGETSWHRFAGTIVEGLSARGVELAAKRIVPIRSEEYPTPAPRPHNSRFDLTRLQQIFGITPPPWQTALAPELDALATELLATDAPGVV